MIGYATDAGFDALDGAARAARNIPGWNEGRIAREVDEHCQYMERFLPNSTRRATINV